MVQSFLSKHIKVKMGNFSSYVKLSSTSKSKGKLCIIYQEKVYINIVHDDYQIVTKHYLPDRNIGFHILDNLLYVYNVYSNVESNRGTGTARLDINNKEIYLPKKIYDKIVDIYTLTELKKIKSVFIVKELKRLNNYNTFTLTV